MNSNNKTFTSPLRLVLVGQPNSGKSTLFNSVAGYRSISTNFAGSTVTYTNSMVQIHDQTIELVDLPGIYSLTSVDAATHATKQFLLHHHIDLIINVVDASLLCRSLELTLQIAELGLPMLICLNMMDEARRKGMQIDAHKLAEIFGVPVLNTIAAKGAGIDELFHQALIFAPTAKPAQPIMLSKHVESSIALVMKQLQQSSAHVRKQRLTAIKLLENDPYFWRQMPSLNSATAAIRAEQKKLEEEHGQPADQVLSAERHAKTMELFESTAYVSKAKKNAWRDKVDDILMHPLWGYLILFAVLYVLFTAIFKLGSFLERPILAFFQQISAHLSTHFAVHSFTYNLLNSLVQGFSGGFSIVFPYLLPFLLLMAIIEDIGYLPRMAFLTDNIMHKMGLHGAAIVPLILGYGCTVPAIMATRVISSTRDRFIASTLSLLVPCSARMTLILGLVGYYLGGQAAFWLYLFNLIVIILIGIALARLLPEDTPGMIMEIPAYQRPRLWGVWAKTWLRMKDFITIAWPLLIVGSIFLSLTEWLHWQEPINRLLSPLTHILDLPEKTGLTIVFGILRKELSLLMLFQALGTTDVLSVMTQTQVFVFTVFVVFYLPCLATFGIMIKELGIKKSLLASMLSLILAIVLAFGARWIAPLFLS